MNPAPLEVLKDKTRLAKTPRVKKAPDRVFEKAAKKLRCAGCKTEISDENRVFTMTSGPPVFVNRFGFLHQVITVRSAENLIFEGAPTLADTWFAGYAWQIALCAGCGQCLGWRYTAVRADSEPSCFFGLRVQVIEIR